MAGDQSLSGAYNQLCGDGVHVHAGGAPSIMNQSTQRSAGLRRPRVFPPTKWSKNLSEPVIMQHIRCWNCHYDLFGAHALHRCPECGVADPWMGRRKAPTKFWSTREEWRRLPRLGLLLVCAVAVTLALLVLLS